MRPIFIDIGRAYININHIETIEQHTASTRAGLRIKTVSQGDIITHKFKTVEELIAEIEHISGKRHR